MGAKEPNESMSKPMAEPNAEKIKRSQWLVLVMLAVIIVPSIGALILFVGGWRPDSTKNYGELVVPARPLVHIQLQTLENKRIGETDLQGKWTLIYFATDSCGEDCQKNLYNLRQIHISQGKNQPRIRRMLILTGDSFRNSAAKIRMDYPELTVVGGSEMAMKSFVEQFRLPAGSPLGDKGRVYIIDPLGNLMMSYPAGSDPTGIRKDLSRLLYVSHIG